MWTQVVRFVPAVLVAAGAVWAVVWLLGVIGERDALAARVTSLHNDLVTCGARLKNIMEDHASDATVNDPADFTVPDHWMWSTGTESSD